jgi:hypothetical protein
MPERLVGDPAREDVEDERQSTVVLAGVGGCRTQPPSGSLSSSATRLNSRRPELVEAVIIDHGAAPRDLGGCSG